jgi:hypothetical protein
MFLSADQFDAGWRHRKVVGEQLGDFPVRTAFCWRGCRSDSKLIVAYAQNLVATGSGLHANFEQQIFAVPLHKR